MMDIKWILILEVLYVVLLVFVCLRIIWDTRSVTKSLAYLLLVIFVPILGMIVYFSFGINYRKRKIYSKKLQISDTLLESTIDEYQSKYANLVNNDNKVIASNLSVIKVISNPKFEVISPLFHKNKVKILINGEACFPTLLEKLKNAKHSIHLEYYIFENDEIGNEIKDILIKKAKEGVTVRFIYDDFGSQNIRKEFAAELRNNGIAVYPFNQIRLLLLANRLNYRNHRKIVVIDGKTSFVGGINICDKYINNGKYDLYWRDTHLMIEGNATYKLQSVFLSDWNFCSGQQLNINHELFPPIENDESYNSFVQIISSGPDSEAPTILYSIIQAINSAKSEILLTTPYFVPDENLQQALILSALSGVKIILLVPKQGDSTFVNIASQAYYEELMKAGVQVYRYTKGFIHAKTFVTDRSLSSIGTANLDLRSFDLNFEVSALVYDEETAEELTNIFYEDIKNAEKIDPEEWEKRPFYIKLAEKVFSLFSPLI